MTQSASPLVAYRLAMGLSQRRLADKLGLKGSSTISKWENGQVPAEQVPMVSRLTGIPRERLRPDLYAADPVGVNS